MTIQKNKLILSTLTLLASTLACHAATSLIFPDTPTPVPSPTHTALPSTPEPTLQVPTSTPFFEAACPDLLTDIMDAALVESLYTERAEEDYYVIYTIEDDKLASREDIVVTNRIDAEHDARATHEFIWNYFAAIVPLEERRYLTEFAMVSDGKGEILGAVAPTYNNPSLWTLEVDILDADDNYNLTFTLMHEYGHLITLNAGQVPPNRRVFFSPGDIDIYDQAVAACPQYFTGEGCSNPDSYINEFFDRFWQDFYTEWQEIDAIDDEDEYYDRLDDFYETYQDQFLTDYSATSPAEDIAEAWSFFILSPKPELDSIANEKVLFFYEYPELVKLRESILTNICEVFPY
jgi:hypothetical protein